jgi:cytochrome c
MRAGRSLHAALGAVAMLLGVVVLSSCQGAPPPATSNPAQSKAASKSGSSSQPAAAPAASIGGDAALGRQLFVTKGCVACHKAPGVPEATGIVGPDLRGMGSPATRSKIAALLDNTPENMKHWLLDPPSVKPGTSMPNLGLTEAEATNLTAFMETLK